MDKIHRIFFKLVVSLLLLLAFYIQTSLQQQPASALTTLFAAAPGSTDAFAPATDNDRRKPFLPHEEVDAVHALLDLMEIKPQISFSKSFCGNEAYWSSIECDCSPNNNAICRVIRIDLSNQRLKGWIPKEIGNLSHLENLNLESNMLSGTIPASFANLSKLQGISLGSNLLEGRIPPFLFEMKSLTAIDLSYNFFNGTIPSQFDALPFLESLDLSNNLLSGEIPKQLGNISSLRLL